MRGLRRLGVDVHTFTVRAPGELESLSAEDRREADTTTALRPVSPLRLADVHTRALARHPRAYVGTLARAIRGRAPGAKGFVWQLFYFAQALVFADLCAQRGIFHVHVHHANVAADVTLLAAHFGRAGGRGPRTWSITIHGPTEFDDPAWFRPAMKARAADAVVAISDDGARTLARAAGDDGAPVPVAVVRLGIDVRSIAFRAPRPRSGPLRVLNVAQLVQRKGQAELLEAVAELRRRGVEVALTLVGGGPDRERLEQRARELGIDVRFRGALPHDQTLAAFGEADAFCLPSHAEGLPVVIMEAMAAGVPVVATNIAGVPELVIDGETGLLVEPGQTAALADALERLATDAALAAELATAARARVEQEHDEETQVARLRDLIETVSS